MQSFEWFLSSQEWVPAPPLGWVHTEAWCVLVHRFQPEFMAEFGSETLSQGADGHTCDNTVQMTGTVDTSGLL